MSGKQEKNEVILFLNPQEAIENAKIAIKIDAFGENEIESYSKLYLGMTADDVDNLPAYNAIVDGAKKMKYLRTSIEKKRKEITKPALDFQTELKAFADNLVAQIVPIEEHLVKEKTKFDDKKKAIEEKLFSDRTKSLSEFGYQLNNGIYILGVLHLEVGKIISMDEKEFEFYVNEGKKEQERIRLEKERKENEANELNARLKALEDRERALAERERAISEKEQEVSVQAEALEKTYETIENKVSEIPNVETPPTNTITEELPKEPIAPTEDVAKESGHAWGEDAVVSSGQLKVVSDEYIQGFSEMKNLVLAKLSNPDPVKRQDLIAWVANQQPTA